MAKSKKKIRGFRIPESKPARWTKRDTIAIEHWARLTRARASELELVGLRASAKSLVRWSSALFANPTRKHLL